MKRCLKTMVLGALLCCAMITVSLNVFAAALFNPQAANNCTGSVWHFVHPQLKGVCPGPGESPPTLTVNFSNCPSQTLIGTTNANCTNINYPSFSDTGCLLVSAFDSVSAGKLVLSDCPAPTVACNPKTDPNCPPPCDPKTDPNCK